MGGIGKFLRKVFRIAEGTVAIGAVVEAAKEELEKADAALATEKPQPRRQP